MELALLKAARPQLDASREALLQRLERIEAPVASSAGARGAGGWHSPCVTRLAYGGACAVYLGRRFRRRNNHPPTPGSGRPLGTTHPILRPA